MNATELSLLAFATCNALRVAAYLPQMVKLVRDPGAARSFSYASWTLFTAANASTAVYAVVVLDDAVIAALHGLSAVCCGVLLALARHMRSRMRPTVGALRSALG